MGGEVRAEDGARLGGGDEGAGTPSPAGEDTGQGAWGFGVLGFWPRTVRYINRMGWVRLFYVIIIIVSRLG